MIVRQLTTLCVSFNCNAPDSNLGGKGKDFSIQHCTKSASQQEAPFLIEKIIKIGMQIK